MLADDDHCPFPRRARKTLPIHYDSHRYYLAQKAEADLQQLNEELEERVAERDSQLEASNQGTDGHYCPADPATQPV
ncbi:MAG: hypothetical protein R2857_02950 [Vampirovibrionales bacterium]